MVCLLGTSRSSLVLMNKPIISIIIAMIQSILSADIRTRYKSAKDDPRFDDLRDFGWDVYDEGENQ